MTTQPNAGGGSAPAARRALDQTETGAPAMRPACRPTIWQGEKLEALRVAYEAGTPKLEAVAHDHGLTQGHITKLAVKHGWRLRRANKAKR